MRRSRTPATPTVDAVDDARATSRPPLPMAAYARAIWIGVTAIPCPMGTVPIVDPDHWSSGRANPEDSPGKSMPVGFPNPKRSIQEARRPAPRRCAIVIVPIFDEYSTTCLTVIRWVPRVWDSRITRSATFSLGARRKAVVGLTTPSWSAAAMATSLNVEPGS
jgi:hypothetical protein